MTLMQITPRTAIAATLALSLIVIGTVLFSQYVQGYQPCELCLRERLPWYVAIGLGIVGLAAPSRWMLGLIALAWLVSAGLGLHHVGVEQHWWLGPQACTGGASGANSIEELRAMMHAQQFVQCDAITWRVFGLSMATYNFLFSLAAGLAAAVVTMRLNRAR